MSNSKFHSLSGESHRWQVVKVDASRLIQGYIDDTRVDFKLLGYTIGTDPTYFTVPADITPGTTGSWTTVSVSAEVDADADGVILFLASENNKSKEYAVREVGSSFSTTSLEMAGCGHAMYAVSINASDQFDIYIEDSNVRVYLIGQTKGSVVYYTNDLAVTDPPTGSWQEIAADTYGVPSEANGLFLRAANTGSSSYRIGFHHSDSTDDWAKYVDANTHTLAATGLRASGLVWDEFIGNTAADVSIAAYTRQVGASFTAHADVDILVRKADGSIRTTIGTNVANSGNITSTAWQTLTGTYSFPGYTVVDSTDYLEIDLFAEATENGMGSSMAVDFRIDNSSLSTTDQIKAS